MRKSLLFLLPVVALTIIGCEPKPKTYTITWQNYDGTILEVDEEVEKDAMPQFNGATPERPGDAQYTYNFKGWSPDVVAATKDATYVAQYDTTVRTYQVRWVDYDDQLLEEDNDVPYGTVPTYDGAIPTRETDAVASYEFSGWTPKVGPITGETVYRAVYNENLVYYTVKWVVEGTTVKTESLPYGAPLQWTDEEPSKENTAQYSYTFAGWKITDDLDLNLGAIVVDDVTLYAKFRQTTNTYTIRFQDDEGEELETVVVEYGVTPEFSFGTPYKYNSSDYSYIFTGWDKEIVPATEDTVYTAQFDESRCGFYSNGYGTGYIAYKAINKNFTGELVIPEKWGGLPVTDLSNGFRDCAFTKLTINAKITEIDTSTFRNCTSLKEVTFPNTLQYIDQYAFGSCSSIEEIVFPNSLGQTSNRRALADWAFDSCSSLRRITFGPDFTGSSVGHYAFEKCYALTEAVFQGTSSVNIGGGSYYLAATVVNGGPCGTFTYVEPNGDNIGLVVYQPANSTTKIIAGRYGTSGTVLNTEGYNKVKFGAFYGDSTLKKLYVGASTSYLGQAAFMNNSALEEIHFAGTNGMEMVGSLCANCTALKVLDFGERTIWGISNLAFSNAGQLTQVTLPNGLQSLMGDAFINSGLTSLHIPASVTFIHSNPVVGSPVMAEYTVDPANTNYKSVDGALFDIDMKEIIAYPTNPSVTSYTIPNGVQTIRTNSFIYTKLQELTIPATVTSIEAKSLYESSITTLNFLGTHEQWNAISFAAYWRSDTLTSVTCSDGTFDL